MKYGEEQRQYYKQRAQLGLCRACNRPRALTLYGRLGVYCSQHVKQNRAKWWAKHPNGSVGKPLLPLDSFSNILVADLRYAAGLLDGEGHFRVGNTGNAKRGLYPGIILVMTDREPVTWIHKLFGGRLRKCSIRSGRDAWRWVVQGRLAGAVAKALVPYLLIKNKRERAKLIVEVSELVNCAHHWKVRQQPELQRKIDRLFQRMVKLMHRPTAFIPKGAFEIRLGGGGGA